MNQEIEYAEMLEIPVSTVNVVHKKRRKKNETRATQAPLSSTPQSFSAALAPALPPVLQTPQSAQDAPLKDTVIAQVNDRLGEDLSINNDAQQENMQTEGGLRLDPVPERIDTVRLYAADELKDFERKGLRAQEGDFNEEQENEPTRYALNPKKQPSKAVRIALGVEFAAACVLCGAIFFTNVFMPNSGINTFFRGVTNTQTAASVNDRPYSDFVLSSIVSDFSDVTLTLSENGVLSFTDECCVYPAADGAIAEVIKDESGAYTIKIRYSDSFTGVFQGLNQVFYQVGDKVKSNVPVGYSNGDAEVQVTMYSDGELLNCFRLTEENCIAWVNE